MDETRVLAGKLKKEAQQLKKAHNKNSHKREQLVSAIKKKMRLLEEEQREKYCIRTDDRYGCENSPAVFLLAENDDIKTEGDGSSCSTPKVKKKKKFMNNTKSSVKNK